MFHVRHLATRPGATFFLPDTAGAQIHDAVTPAAGERVVTKHHPNSFRETTLVRAAADLGFACSLAQDGCATRELRFAGTPVDAASVQLAYLAGLNGSFAAVKPAEELIAAL